MDQDMRGYCGCDCASCEWREKKNCQGCKACAGEVFWGACDVAKCAMEKGFAHCGHCKKLPCELLQSFYDDPEEGDDGERLQRLKDWTKE